MPYIHPFTPENFYKSLANRYCSSDAAQANKSAASIYKHLRLRGAQTIIVEENYIDGDYVDDFALYYVKCFERYSIRCKRIHFFDSKGGELSNEGFERLACGEAHKDEMEAFQSGYLGFIVARPLPEAIIGRTVLKPDIPGSSANHFSLIFSEVNLLGVALSLKSLPFQQQDKVVAACGTVALWVSLQKSNHLFNTITPRPAAISMAANLVVGPRRSLPSHALKIEQMCSAVRQAGLEPEVIDLQNELPLRSILYAYLKAGLCPVIVAEVEDHNELHAITVNGYKLDQDTVQPRETSKAIGALSMKADNIGEFFAHDDQVGPFTSHTIAPVKGEKRNPAALLSPNPWKNKQKKTSKIFPLAVLIPVYNKIRLSYTHIETWLNRLNATTQPMLKNRPHVWDLYLTSTNEYKRDLVDENAPLSIRKAVILRQHPRFLWRAVLYIDQQRAMELLFDATDIPMTFPGYCLIWYATDFRGVLKKSITSYDLRDRTRKNLSEKFYDFLLAATHAEVHFYESEALTDSGEKP